MWGYNKALLGSEQVLDFKIVVTFKAMECSRCSSVEFRHSRFRWWEYLLVFLLVRPYRCDICERRRFGFLWRRMGKG